MPSGGNDVLRNAARRNVTGRDVAERAMSERDDARVLRLLARHARTATAFQSLAPGMRHWFDRANDSGTTTDDIGTVAYVDTGSAWVAAGEPVASREHTIGVAERFVAHATSVHKRAAFFATEGALAASPRFRRVLIGEQPVWNPADWSAVIAANRSLREQLRRARAKGIVVRELRADDVRPGSVLRAALDRIARRWLMGKPMTSLHFLVELEPFEQLEHRRLFVAERTAHDETVTAEPVAFLSLAPVAARNGWMFEHMLRAPSAPNGTSELLVDFTMRALAADGVTWATLGLAPLSGPVSGWLRTARTLARPFYNFAGLSAFKRKLRPERWEPIYLVYPRERHSVWAMRDGLRAFAGGSLVAFGLRTILRGPPPLLRALELSLIPWTMALALWPASPWFPSPVVKWSWVVFDVLLLAALFRLRTRGARGFAVGIAVAVSLDTVLTLAQAAFWNVSRARSVFEAAMIVVACTGPALAAAVLWGAIRREAQLDR